MVAYFRDAASRGADGGLDTSPSQRLSAARTPSAEPQGQFKIGNGAFYGLNYIQSVTPSLSMGGEAFWLGTQRKSGIGFAARHATDKHVGTVQARRR